MKNPMLVESIVDIQEYYSIVDAVAPLIEMLLSKSH